MSPWERWGEQRVGIEKPPQAPPPPSSFPSPACHCGGCTGASSTYPKSPCTATCHSVPPSESMGVSIQFAGESSLKFLLLLYQQRTLSFYNPFLSHVQLFILVKTLLFVIRVWNKFQMYKAQFKLIFHLLSVGRARVQVIGANTITNGDSPVLSHLLLWFKCLFLWLFRRI